MTRLGKRVQIIGECWAVNGDLDNYAQVNPLSGSIPAHRYVYEELHDVTLERCHHVHHICGHPGCIRPDHLAAVTVSDHMAIHAGKITVDQAERVH